LGQEKPIYRAERGAHGEVSLMERVKFDCDCDRVIEMEDMDIRIEEILQYARGAFEKDEIVSLIQGLQELAGKNGDC
jgi:hypothetical protein